MNKRSVVFSITVATMVFSMIGATTQITNMVYADPDEKEKRWSSDDVLSTGNCTKKDDDCKAFKDVTGSNANKFVRDTCNNTNPDDEKCKQEK